jgi:hypothetical protein
MSASGTHSWIAFVTLAMLHEYSAPESRLAPKQHARTIWTMFVYMLRTGACCGTIPWSGHVRSVIDNRASTERFHAQPGR